MKRVDFAYSDGCDSPLKVAVNNCCDPSAPSDDQPKTFKMLDLLLRHGASMRTKASETRDESARNNILSYSVMIEHSFDSSWNLAALVKLLHVGKPDASVVEETIQLTDNRLPISHRILSDYLRGSAGWLVARLEGNVLSLLAVVVVKMSCDCIVWEQREHQTH